MAMIRSIGHTLIGREDLLWAFVFGNRGVSGASEPCLLLFRNANHGMLSMIGSAML